MLSRVFRSVIHDLGGIVGPILSGSHFANLLKHPAEIGGIAVTATGSNLLERHTVILQHELRAIYPHQVEVIIESHESFLAKEPGNMVWSQPEMMRDTLSGNRTVEVLLNV